MIRDAGGRLIADGAACEVIGGTHKGRRGTAADLNISKSGHATLTVREADGTRFKALARNVRVEST